MDAFVQRIFESEIADQCRFAIVSALNLNGSLSSLEMPAESLTWYWIQNCLGSAGNISKLLWGKDDQATRADRLSLRGALGISETATMHIQSRTLRNDFEHFDERLITRFADSNVPKNFVGRNIGPPNMISIGGMTSDDWFQHFDPAAGVVSFWDRKVDLKAVMAEIQQIHLAVLARAT